MVNGNSMLPSASFLSLGPAVPPSAGAPDIAAAGTPSPAFAELLNGLAAQASAVLAIGGETSDTAETASVDVEADADTRPAQAASMAVAATSSGNILPVGLPEAAMQEIAKAAVPESSEKPADEQELAPTLADTADVPAAPRQPDATPGDPSVQAALAVAVPLTALEPIPAVTVSRSGAGTATAPSTRRALSRPVEVPHKLQQADAPAEQRAPSAVRIAVAAPAAPAAHVAPVAPAATETAETVAALRPKPLRAAEQPAADAPTQAGRAPGALPAPAQPEPVSTVHAAHARVHGPSPADIDATLDRLMAAREALAPAEASVSIDHADFGEVSIRFEHAADGRLSAELSAADPDLPRAVTAAIASDRSTATGSETGRSAGGTAQRGFGDGAGGGRGHPSHDGEPARRQAPRHSAGAGASDSGIFA